MAESGDSMIAPRLEGVDDLEGDVLDRAELIGLNDRVEEEDVEDAVLVSNPAFSAWDGLRACG